MILNVTRKEGIATYAVSHPHSKAYNLLGTVVKCTLGEEHTAFLISAYVQYKKQCKY